jgi:hypothetical protein
LGIDPLKHAREVDRGTPVLELAVPVDKPARLALAVAEVPVVEDQRGDPGLGKAVGEGAEPGVVRAV